MAYALKDNWPNYIEQNIKSWKLIKNCISNYPIFLNQAQHKVLCQTVALDQGERMSENNKSSSLKILKISSWNFGQEEMGERVGGCVQGPE